MAVVVGLAVAALLLLSSRLSMRAMTPESGPSGFAIVSIALFARLAVATLALWAYKSVALQGFKPFALAVAGGFLILYTVELVRYAGLHRYRRSVPARH